MRFGQMAHNYGEISCSNCHLRINHVPVINEGKAVSQCGSDLNFWQWEDLGIQYLCCHTQLAVNFTLFTVFSNWPRWTPFTVYKWKHDAKTKKDVFKNCIIWYQNDIRLLYTIYSTLWTTIYYIMCTTFMCFWSLTAMATINFTILKKYIFLLKKYDMKMHK